MSAWGDERVHNCSRHPRTRVVLMVLAVVLFGVVSQGSAQQLSITHHDDLTFGALVPYAGGTVTVSPLGSRSAAGGVLPVTVGSALPAAGQFTITGDPDTVYSIDLPTSVILSDGTHTMLVDGFNSSPQSTGALGPTGAQTLKVGATLHVSSAQAQGQYTGSYDVEVTYN